MSLKTDLWQLLKPYYWFNIMLSLSYIIAKRTPVICTFLFPSSDCELETRETEILFFLMIVVMLRTRKSGSVTMVNYLSASFIYTKLANLVLWFYADVRMGLIYAVIFILCGLMLPEPTYQGPENVVYFRGLEDLESELARDKKTTWMVCFYAAWHPACVTFAPVFSKLSADYHLPNFKFGKVDIGRFPQAAARYHIVDGPTSRQLPSLLLFKAAQEADRRPNADARGKLNKFLFSVDNIKASFDLETLYKECKEKKAESKKTK